MISRKNKVRPFGMKIQNGPVGSVLSNMFRRIMSDLCLDGDRYDALMRRYIQKAVLFGGRKDRADARAGLSEELLKNTMTWKTFLKGLKFLGIVKAEVMLTLAYKRSKTEVHAISFALSDFDVESDEDDEKCISEDQRAPGNILGKLYSMIRDESTLTEAKSEMLMQDYIKRSHFSVTKKNEAAIRASLTKELSRSVMTWKTLVKALNFHAVVSFQLRVNLHHASSRVTSHQLEPIVIGELDNEED